MTGSMRLPRKHRVFVACGLALLFIVGACTRAATPRRPPPADERRVEETPEPVEEEDPAEPPVEHRAPFPAFGNKIVKPASQVKRKPRYTRARPVRPQ